MDLRKHDYYFDPLTLIGNKEIHLIGCGAYNSWIALSLVKLGVKKLHIWDFDTVSEHNLTNQVYDKNDIGMLKTDAIKRHLQNVNPDVIIETHGKYTVEMLNGIVFLGPDKIAVRREFFYNNEFNMGLEMFIDGRIGFDESQVYFTIINNEEDVERYRTMIESFDDSSENIATNVSPCGTELNVIPCVLDACSTSISIFMKYLKGELPERGKRRVYNYPMKGLRRTL